MSNNAYDSHGITIEYSLDGGSTYVELGDVLDVEAPGREADMHETSDHSSRSKTFLGSMIDEGRLVVPLNFRPDNTGHRAVRDNVGSNLDWRVTLPAEVTTYNQATFVGTLMKFGQIELPKSGVIASGIEVQVSGAQTWATS